MEDETYIYQGVEFSRQELEEKYGDRTDEAIEKHFQVKKRASAGYFTRFYRAFRDSFRRY